MRKKLAGKPKPIKLIICALSSLALTIALLVAVYSSIVATGDVKIETVLNRNIAIVLLITSIPLYAVLSSTMWLLLTPEEEDE